MYVILNGTSDIKRSTYIWSSVTKMSDLYIVRLIYHYSSTSSQRLLCYLISCVFRSDFNNRLQIMFLSLSSIGKYFHMVLMNGNLCVKVHVHDTTMLPWWSQFGINCSRMNQVKDAKICWCVVKHHQYSLTNSALNYGSHCVIRHLWKTFHNVTLLLFLFFCSVLKTFFN